jgi:hypothetical protein
LLLLYSPFKASSCLPSCINLNPATSASRNVCGCDGDDEDFDCSDFDDDEDEADDDDCNLVDDDLNVLFEIIVGPVLVSFSSFSILRCCCCCMILLLLLLLAVKALALKIMMRNAERKDFILFSSEDDSCQ